MSVQDKHTHAKWLYSTENHLSRAQVRFSLADHHVVSVHAWLVGEVNDNWKTHADAIPNLVQSIRELQCANALAGRKTDVLVQVVAKQRPKPLDLFVEDEIVGALQAALFPTIGNLMVTAAYEEQTDDFMAGREDVFLRLRRSNTPCGKRVKKLAQEASQVTSELDHGGWNRRNTAAMKPGMMD